jgi:hypothetical protein
MSVDLGSAAPAATPALDWIELNQRQLDSELRRLTSLVAGEEPPPASGEEPPPASGEASTQSALDVVAHAFALSPFERDLLALCAGVELHPPLAAAVAVRGGPIGFELAQQVLPDPHWSALTPGGPLRSWRLLDLAPGPVARAPLSVPERVLHFLVGLDELDQLLVPVVAPLRPATLMADSHVEVASAIAHGWADPERAWQPVSLHGDDAEGRRDVAWTACVALGLQPFVVRVTDLPAHPGERAELARLWSRDARLSGAALVVDVDERGRGAQVADWVSRVDAPVLITAAEAPAVPDAVRHEVRRPEPPEQRRLWQAALDAAEPGLESAGSVADLLATTHRLSAHEIHDVAMHAAQAGEPVDLARAVQARLHVGDLDGLARVVPAMAGWADLVLPEDCLAPLHALTEQVRFRRVVHDDWGFAGRGSRGLGTTALFVGEPGTGKTMAAEVIALDLELDLLHVDLSAVISKYIGETEKNLRRIFDLADELGAILLFDEADALFGKRSEVRDSHDRYANIEVSYLLQRMEAYRGLALLTTNARANLDTAFARRLGYIVQFPFPDREHRRRIWAGAFPARTPTERLDPSTLASLAVSGGSIRNIAVSAAYRAAAAGTPVRMADLAWAARAELAKAERAASPSDLAGWGP